jgi:hypothetical protein
MHRASKLVLTVVFALILLPLQSFAAANQQSFSQEELDQLVAPIALYPDPLLAQILMASTYPLEIVTAARWTKENAALKGKALTDALAEQTWDPSVKSLTAVADVLNMLNTKLDMTIKLGDAFLADQKKLLDTVQSLRAKAQTAGHLKTTKEQVVKTDNTYISIEPSEPQMVYVPAYDPNIVYGAWPYPDYPPYYYYPHGFSAGMALSFGAGLIVGDALWGHCDWGNHNVNINVNQYNNFNHARINDNHWAHNPEHRGNVPYRDHNLAQKYNKDQLKDREARDAFRGRAEEGRQEMARGGENGIQNLDRAANQKRQDQHRENKQAQQRTGNEQFNRQAHFNEQRMNAFDGVHHGQEMNHFSERGSMSRGFEHHESFHGGEMRGGGNVRHGGGGHGGGGRRR